MSRPRALARLLSAALAAGTLVAVAPAPSDAVDPVDQALVRLDQDADRPLTIRTAGDGIAEFVGVPARAEVENPHVRASMSPAAAGDAAIARYGAALGTARPGTTLERTSVQDAVTGEVVSYQQNVGGIPVLGGEIAVSLREDGQLSSMLANTSAETSVPPATVTEAAAGSTARAVLDKSEGQGDGTRVESLGRWVLDPGLIGGDAAAEARTVWRFEVTRRADQRREVMVDDRTGGVLMNVDLIVHADRVVCDNGNVQRGDDVPCAYGVAARAEGDAASGVADVNTAYDLSGATSDFYQQVAGIDLTGLLGIWTGGGPKLASTVNWCYTGETCPYANAFWNGSQMYYGAGYAGADDVVGHEITHGFTERNSGLFYWGQSGAMNESISDIIGEIIDHRNPSPGDSPTSWALGEDVPGYSPDGLRNVQDPTLFESPDKTSSPFYVQESHTYPDNDGVHTNSGVGNHTFYLISQGGSFNGQTITGIDSGDPGLTKSAKLWVLVDQSLTSGSDYADEAIVLDQSCQALLADDTDGFTAADCAAVHQATLATELHQTPLNSAQPDDAEATCPSGIKRVLLDSETGNPTAKLASTTWSRDSALAHSGPDSWSVGNVPTTGAWHLSMPTGVALPGGQKSYLFFRHWRVLDWQPGHNYDVGTVEVDDSSGPADTAGLPWVNGPTDVIDKTFGNPASATLGFGGDSRGYLASRADLSSYAGKTVKARFTLNTDSSIGYVGWAVDDVAVYTCDSADSLANSTLPRITGWPQVGVPLTAVPGTWMPDVDPEFDYQWYRGDTPIVGATEVEYTPTVHDVGSTFTVRVTASKGAYEPVSAISTPTAAVVPGYLTASWPSIEGDPVFGETLAALPGTWGPGEVELSYQWQRDGDPIGGATDSSYELRAADVGAAISVEVTGTKDGYDGEIRTSADTAVVAPATLTVGAPSISGTAVYGETLRATPGTWGPGEVGLRYQWLRDGDEIAGATDVSYLLTVADLGAVVSVAVTGARDGYATATAMSGGTAAVASATLTPGAPEVTGTAVQGRTLTAATGAWAPSRVDFVYQWRRNGAAITGAVAPTYVLTAADARAVISVQVTGTRAGYATTSATSPSTTEVVGLLTPGRPTLSGTATVGKKLKAKAGTWGPGAVGLAYTWLRNGKPIAGASARTYTLRKADQGKRISVRVTGSRTGYLSEVATSKATGKVKAAAKGKPKKRR